MFLMIFFPTAPDMRIAAVVNDEVISLLDLVSRLRMVLMSSNIPDSAEARHRTESQVLRLLVDEKLQLQEAKKQNIVATDDEINRVRPVADRKAEQHADRSADDVPQVARALTAQLADQSGYRVDRLGQVGSAQSVRNDRNRR